MGEIALQQPDELAEPAYEFEIIGRRPQSVSPEYSELISITFEVLVLLRGAGGGVGFGNSSRNNICAVCICVLINPGIIILPDKSTISSWGYLVVRASVLPTSVILLPSTRILPSRIIFLDVFTVMIVPCA